MKLKKPVQMTLYTDNRKYYFYLVLILTSTMFAQTGNDIVLQDMCLGMESFYENDYDRSELCFDSAIDKISKIWSDTPDARKARSLWYGEKIKPFKGEPYERMMVYYYRGLLYLFRHDYGNAQACFRESILQDAFAEEEQFRADVALPLFFLALSSQVQQSNHTAQESYKALKCLRPDFPEIEGNSIPSLVLVVETGNSPRKVADGVGSYQLKYFRGKNFSDKFIEFSINGGSWERLYPVEDIYYQAASRGGRMIDKIIQGKVQFKESSEIIGTTLSDVSLSILENSESYSKKTQEYGMYIGLIGVGALILSGNTKPAVDTRYWDNIPDAVHLIPLYLKPGNYCINIRSLSINYEVLNGLNKSIDIKIPESPQDLPVIQWLSIHDRNSKSY